MRERGKDDRPDPDELLESLQQESEGRGNLKIYLGASPGVGKTYAMLEDAEHLKQKKVDVVVGVVETHGRAETKALLKDLEVIPRKKIQHRDRLFSALDVEAIIQRRPNTVLIDELAHSNFSSERHKKRYQDIADILAVGINVYATVNIQHVESLNDDVQQITGIQIKETIPDSVILDADEIILIDLPTKALRQRLAEGKVYVKNMAKNAAQNYFKEGNLIALRELAMKYATMNVQKEILHYKHRYDISNPWPVAETLVACASMEEASHSFIRRAKRLADQLNAKFSLICVEYSSRLSPAPGGEQDVQTCLRYAKRLGADVITIQSPALRSTLFDYTAKHNVTHIALLQSSLSWHKKLFKPSLNDEIVRLSGSLNIHFLNKTDKTSGLRKKRSSTAFVPYNLLKFVYCIVLIGISITFDYGLQQVFSVTTNTLLLLFAIIFVAYKWGTYPSLLTALISAVYVNYAYIHPTADFAISSLAGFLTLVVFVVISITVGQLALNLKRQIIASNKRQRLTKSLYDFTTQISQATDLNDLLSIITVLIHKTFGLASVIYMAENNQLKPVKTYPEALPIPKKTQAAANWSFEHKKACGKGTDTLSDMKWHIVPLQSTDEDVALLGVNCANEAEKFLGAENYNHFQNIAEQSANAIMRMLLSKENEQNRIFSETERLRSALLRSVSHDLRTPLVSIKGAISELLESAGQYDEQTKEELLSSAYAETERLNRYISNLLQMTKLESKGLALNIVPSSLVDVVNNAASSTRLLSRQHKLNINVPVDLPLVEIDPVMTEQVFINLIVNAVKYSKAGTSITIAARNEKGKVIISVKDQGCGIPQEDLESIFDLFYRAQNDDKKNEGSGMGLAICRGILDNENAKIMAYSDGPNKGTVFTVTFSESTKPIEDSIE